MDTGQVAELLRRTKLFGAVNDTIRQRIAEGATRYSFTRGQTIFVQDETGDRLFVVAEGGVKLYLRSRHGEIIELVRHKPPAVFGELALLDGGPRSACAEAVEPTVLVAVTRDQLIHLLRLDVRAVDALLRSLGDIVRRTTQQMADLVFLDLQGRLASKLIELGGTGEHDLPGRHITQTELANMVGGVRQTVNLALRGLQDRGYIRITGGNVEILQLEGLRRRAGG
jgi:CRP/FNR family transcriptional regulator, cyclic AMP receptor protein